MLHTVQGCCTAFKCRSPHLAACCPYPGSPPTLCASGLKDLIFIQLFHPSIQNRGWNLAGVK